MSTQLSMQKSPMRWPEYLQQKFKFRLNLHINNNDNFLLVLQIKVYYFVKFHKRSSCWDWNHIKVLDVFFSAMKMPLVDKTRISMLQSIRRATFTLSIQKQYLNVKWALQAYIFPLIFSCYVLKYNTWLQAGWSGEWILVGTRDFSFSKMSAGSGDHPASSMGASFLSQGKAARAWVNHSPLP